MWQQLDAGLAKLFPASSQELERLRAKGRITHAWREHRGVNVAVDDVEPGSLAPRKGLVSSLDAPAAGQTHHVSSSSFATSFMSLADRLGAGEEPSVIVPDDYDWSR